MNLAIRRADFEADKELIISTLFASLTRFSDARRFSWLYENSPHGRASAWVAINTQDDTIVGVGTAFPRRIYVDRHDCLCWVLGDFCLDAAYRSLGPALQLQRACLGVTESNGGMFCYDFPSASMVAVYKRLGVEPTGRMLRLAKPLRVDRKVKEMIKNAAVERMVTSVCNALLKRASPRADADESLEVAIHTQLCGEEFTVLARNSGASLVCVWTVPRST